MSASPLLAPASRRGVAAYVSMRGVTTELGVRADGSRRVAPVKASLRGVGATDSVRGAIERGAIDSVDPEREMDGDEGADDGGGAWRGASMRGAAERELAAGADCGAGADEA